MRCNTMYCTALHCTALFCTVKHCAAMHYTALHCTALHCTALHCTALHCTALHCTALHCTALCTVIHCPALHYNELHCTALQCTVLHCTALHCTALHCTALHCTALHCTALHCTALHCTALHCTTLHCTALHCTALHCTALHCTALHCTVALSLQNGFWLITIHLKWLFLEFHVRSSLWMCVAGVTKRPERPLKRPLHTLKTTLKALWGQYRQYKRPLGHFGPDKKDLKLFELFFIEGALRNKSLSLWNGCVPRHIYTGADWRQIFSWLFDVEALFIRRVFKPLFKQITQISRNRLLKTFCRLDLIKMISLQKRLERYRAMYVLKKLEGLSPNCGIEVKMEGGRLGGTCSIYTKQ